MWAPLRVFKADFSRHDPLSRRIEELWVVCRVYRQEGVRNMLYPADTAPQFLWKLAPSTKILTLTVKEKIISKKDRKR